jgi:hypothetical protein
LIVIVGGVLKKPFISIVFGLLIYRLFLFLNNKFLQESLNNLGFIFKISPYIVLPFFIGLLIAYIINSKKNLGWLYGGLFVVIDYIMGIFTVSTVGYSLMESLTKSIRVFLFLGIFSLLFAMAGGKCGDLLRGKKVDS